MFLNQEDHILGLAIGFQNGDTVALGVRAHGRLSLERLHSTHVVHGYYSSTSDFQAIVDAPSTHPGLVLSVGFNGNGFMMAPANARLVTSLVTGEEPTYDHADYQLARFEQQVHMETAVI